MHFGQKYFYGFFKLKLRTDFAGLMRCLEYKVVRSGPSVPVLRSAALAAEVLGDEDGLRRQWAEELKTLHSRICK